MMMFVVSLTPDAVFCLVRGLKPVCHSFPGSRHLPMIAGLLHSRIHLNLREFRQHNHMTFFSNVLAILELLQPLVFHGDHQGALQDCLLSFMKVLQVGISCCQALSDAGFRLGICCKYGQISVSNMGAYLCPPRTFRGLARR